MENPREHDNDKVTIPAQTSAEKVETRTLCVLVDTAGRAGARGRAVLRPRLQYRFTHCLGNRAPEHLSRITIVTSRHADGARTIRTSSIAGAGRSRRHLTTRARRSRASSRWWKLHGTGEQRMEALRLADAFRARVIDATTESFVFEITGASDKIESSSICCRSGSSKCAPASSPSRADRRGCRSGYPDDLSTVPLE